VQETLAADTERENKEWVDLTVDDTDVRSWSLSVAEAGVSYRPLMLTTGTASRRWSDVFGRVVHYTPRPAASLPPRPDGRPDGRAIARSLDHGARRWINARRAQSLGQTDLSCRLREKKRPRPPPPPPPRIGRRTSDVIDCIAGGGVRAVLGAAWTQTSVPGLEVPRWPRDA